MMKRLAFLILLFSSATAATSLASEGPRLSSFEKLDSLMTAEPRNVVISISASWCKYCRLMQSSVYNHPSISSLLNNRFYYIELDAESRAPIRFKNMIFKNEEEQDERGVHQLAKILGTVDGSLSYPTLSILNKDFEIIYQRAGLIKREDMRSILLKAAAL